MQAFFNYLDHYHDDITKILVFFSLCIFSALVWLWYVNRKKYHFLKHQIPATVVKDYLDSIIQNSTALKSSLFRGGGLDVDPNSVPAVRPAADLGEGGDAALQAEIARLRAELAEKTATIADLETKNTSLSEQVDVKQKRIEELEALLAKAQEGGGGGADPAELAAITAERDKLKEDLQQYDVIADDLADLKRYKQENEQLRKALEEAGGAAPAAAAPEPVAEPEPAAAPPAEEPPAEEPAAEAAPAEEAPAEEEPAADAEGDDKTPEDLLSEFEKMLG